ncbi:nucleoside 2-deoxyribosyltransferase [Bifidobacterium avesanii]|uniref:Nucleoside 2-deoxyribosyltransferase n=1 Tax=Bifidobacterium avesanii TaxID=1798157 RepID=A0A7K3TII6_9BIFI|nr:nucleoside 2-deoxyribosyltransferase [Bifidobacterium avesanii]KAB8290923.1 nucleoside deoxyribosyltransferase [Bifidobacterium avesanii]NEG78881.1 nucleoside 2-deoxyribosyltransferase [Bifidobacterium avesanii]
MGQESKEFDFYAAGPFFNDREVASMERLEAVLESHGRKLFKPRFVSEIDEVGPRKCFEDDCAGILASRAVIANLIDDDPGTMFEIGFAHGHGIPVYAYLDGLTAETTVNLMIAQAVDAVFSGPDDLARWLETGVHEEPAFRQF